MNEVRIEIIGAAPTEAAQSESGNGANDKPSNDFQAREDLLLGDEVACYADAAYSFELQLRTDTRYT